MHTDCTDTFIVHYHQVGAGNTEGAGADEDEHRDQQHEEEVGVGGLSDGVSILLDTDTERIKNQGQANAGLISILISANQIKAISQISQSVVILRQALYTSTLISDSLFRMSSHGSL